MDWEDALGHAAERSTVLLVGGPPGIGKSHALAGLVDDARSRGWRLLETSPAEAEVRLGGTALVDLCSTVTDAELELLPTPQRRALGAALWRVEPDGAADPAVVHFAFAHLLERLAAQGPVLLCVDDAQWLDAETESTLAFAIRRTPARGVAWVLATRPDALPSGVTEALRDAPEVIHQEIPPLPPDELEPLLRRRVAATLATDVMKRSIAISGGNPFYALELARALQDHPEGATVPLPASLEELVGARLTTLPPPTRQALAAVAAMRRPDLDMIAALGLADHLPAAEREDVVVVHGRTVSFTHPLLATAAYTGLTGSERTSLHRNLAEATTNPLDRARHLVLAGVGPDAGLARVLADSAEEAVARGALQSGVESLRLALRATPEGDPEAWRRSRSLAVLLFRSGATDEARQLLHQVTGSSEDPTLVAGALLDLARIARAADTLTAAAAAGTAALHAAEATADPGLQIDAHVLLARLPYRPTWEALEHAAAAARLATTPGTGRDRRAAATLASALAAFKAGHGLDDSLFRSAMAEEEGHLAATGDAQPLPDRAAAVYAALLVDCGRLDEARVLLDRLELARKELGDEAALPWLLGHQVKLELWSGRIDVAVRLADQQLAGARRTAQGSASHTARRSLAMVALHTGDLDRAADLAGELVAEGATAGGYVEMMGRGLLGEVALARGDHAAAVAELGRAELLRRADGTEDPAWSRWQAPYVEALVGVGRLDDAAEVAADLEKRAARVGRTLASAMAARCQALIAASRQDPVSALAALDHSDALLAEVRGFPVERAYNGLVRGIVHRRARQKAAARTSLEAARRDFSAIGAAALAERARAERARVGGRAPQQGTDLTETERRVAELAITGMRVTDIAGALFVSPKTVEANLTRIYRKLGVGNRAELVAGWRREQ